MIQHDKGSRLSSYSSGSRSPARSLRGVTLLELVIATAILSIGVLSLIGVFTQINSGVQSSKTKSLATNLVQEKIEALKNIPYHRLLVTTSPVTETKITPNFQYDPGYYPPEIPLIVGGIIFDRRVYVHKVAEGPSGTLIDKAWSDGDTALKEIQVHVIWKQRNEWRSLRASNLRDDPDRSGTDASFSGHVEDTSPADLADVTIDVIQNSAWNALTNASGNYSFQVTAGTYTLRASKSGYFTAFSGQKTVLIGDVEDVDFTLLKMASGTITGIAYIRDHLVISQIVGSTVNPITGFDQEYIELYNPTTYTWTIAQSGPDVPIIGFAYFEEDAVDPNTDYDILDLIYHTYTISPGGYYLIANTDTIRVFGTDYAADAVYVSTQPADTIKTPDAGAIGMARIEGASFVPLDVVGWDRNGGSKTALVYEGEAIDQTAGLTPNEQYVRTTSIGTITSGVGRAYDTGYNEGDFIDIANMIHHPRNSAVTEPVVTGTPASGAIVFTNDNLAPAVTATTWGAFTLLSVATGTWTLTVSKDMFTKDIAGVTVTADNTTGVGVIVLSSASETGYVMGTVTDSVGSGIDAILIIGGGGSNTNTNADGTYSLATLPGLQQIVANPNNDNPDYVSSAQNAIVFLGNVTPNRNFTLAKGASLRGFSSSNGVDAYPGLVAIAKLDGMEQGSAVADVNGYFTITDLSTGSYIVEAIPNSGESVTPSTHTIDIDVTEAGDTLWVGTFTVSGAMGSISGMLMENSSVINTGILIVVTSVTIPGFPPVPPAIDNSLRSGSVKYFNASSGADGRYSVPVVGGYTYNVYAWYTDINGTTVNKSGSATVAVGENKTVNLNWP